VSETRVYCHGALTKDLLAAKLDDGLVLIDVVRNGYLGGDVAYFRAGTDAEIASLRALAATDSLAGAPVPAVDPATAGSGFSVHPVSPCTASSCPERSARLSAERRVQELEHRLAETEKNQLESSATRDARVSDV
jgi:hypothetical protein